MSALTSLRQFILFWLMGLGSWMLASGVFAETPALISTLPEEARIVSQMDLCVNLANVCPLIYVVAQRRWKFRDHLAMAWVLGANLVVCVGIIVTWNRTSNINGLEHSVWLLVWMFFSGVIGNCSVVIFCPFAARYGGQAMSALSTGVGSAGMIAQLLALAQFDQDETALTMHYSVMSFLWILFGFLAISLVALPLCRRFCRPQPLLNQAAATAAAALVLESGHERDDISEIRLMLLQDDMTINQPLHVVQRKAIWTQLLTCWCNYMLPGITPFLASASEHPLALVSWLYMLYYIGSFVGRLLTVFSPISNIAPLTIAQCLMLLLLIVRTTDLGKADTGTPDTGVTLACMFVLTLVHGVINTMCFRLCEGVQAPPEKLRHHERMVGLANQAGALLGALSSFLLMGYVL